MPDLKTWLSDRWLVRRVYDLLFCRGDFVRTIVQRPVIHQAIGTRPLGRVLDSGCGRGMYTPFLWQRARLVVGFDFSEDHLQTMLRRHGHEPGVRFLRASAEALPFRDGSFDFLLCTEVLEHLRNDRQALAEVARVLVPGGRAVVSVPVPPAPVRDREHVREGYTFADLEAMLSEVGLEAGKPRYCLFGISRMTMRIASWYSEHVGLPLPSLLKVPLYLERLNMCQGSERLPYDLVLEVRKPLAEKGQGMGAEESRGTVPVGGVR